MNYRKFGKTDLEVSEVGFGAWAIGGPAMAGDIPIGWGDVDDKTSVAALKKSLDQGVNFFDTADFYGLGHSEELIGKTFSNRSDVIIASKVGHRLDQQQQIYLDYSKKYILEACEQSLKRLKRDQIDFYQLHAARMPHLEEGGCIEAMESLVKTGKIRYWGLSLHTYNPEPEAEYMLSGHHGHGFQVVFNIINQKALPIIKQAAENGMGIIARMPLQFGLLTGKFNRESKFKKDDHRNFRLKPAVLSKSLDALEGVWPLAKKYNFNPAELALSFILNHPEVSTVIPGIKNPEQAIKNTSNLTVLEKNDLEYLHHEYDRQYRDLLEFMQAHG